MSISQLISLVYCTNGIVVETWGSKLRFRNYHQRTEVLISVLNDFCLLPPLAFTNISLTFILQGCLPPGCGNTKPDEAIGSPPGSRRWKEFKIFTGIVTLCNEYLKKLVNWHQLLLLDSFSLASLAKESNSSISRDNFIHVTAALQHR